VFATELIVGVEAGYGVNVKHPENLMNRDLSKAMFGFSYDTALIVKSQNWIALPSFNDLAS